MDSAMALLCASPYTKEEIKEINKKENTGEFLLFDIAGILMDESVNIEYDKVIYITTPVFLTDPRRGEEVKKAILDLLDSNKNSIIIARKGINEYKDKEYAKDLALDMVEFERLGFREINFLCDLEWSIPFIYLNNEPSFALYKEIAIFKLEEEFTKENSSN